MSEPLDDDDLDTLCDVVAGNVPFDSEQDGPLLWRLIEDWRRLRAEVSRLRPMAQHNHDHPNEPEVQTALRVAARIEDDGDHGASEAYAIQEVVRRYRQRTEDWLRLYEAQHQDK